MTLLPAGLLLLALVSAAPKKTPDGDSEVIVCAKDGAREIARVHSGALQLFTSDAKQKIDQGLSPLPDTAAASPLAGECFALVWRIPRAKPVAPMKPFFFLYFAELGASPSKITKLTTVIPEPNPTSPKEKIFFGSAADPRGREFEIWSLDAAGKRVSRLGDTTDTAGFPMFELDSKLLLAATRR